MSLPRSSHDVLVVGAGPAGSSAALRLAGAGARVAVIEKERLPRYKTCGGGVVRRARHLIRIDVSSAVERDCRAVEMRLLDAGLVFSVRREEPILSTTMRGAFDFLLFSAARDAGAEIRSPCAVRGLAARNGCVELETTGGTMSAPFVIAADGARGAVARLAGWEAAPAGIPAVEWEVSVPDRVLERFAGAARFDFGFISSGYAWVFPKRRHLSVGVLAAWRRPARLQRVLESYLEAAGVSPILRAERHGFVIPVRPRVPLARGRVLLCGDAGGLADALTGEGITFAIRSGQLAGEALLAGEFEPERVAEIYRSGVEREILPELRWARRLALWIYRWPRLRTRLFRRCGQRLCEAMTEVIAGGATYANLLEEPLNYLELLHRPVPVSG